jgi:ubiquinone/menaquinone biosynthesis C-methylase UbiE
VDFVLAFYMVHEVQNKEAFFKEIGSLLQPNGQVLVVEPPFHVTKTAFEETLRVAQSVGLTLAERPKIPLSKAVILRKG